MTIKCYTCSWIEFWARKEKNIVGMVGKISAASVDCTSGITVSAHPDLEGCILVMEKCFFVWGKYTTD